MLHGITVEVRVLERAVDPGGRVPQRGQAVRHIDERRLDLAINLRDARDSQRGKIDIGSSNRGISDPTAQVALNADLLVKLVNCLLYTSRCV